MPHRYPEPVNTWPRCGCGKISLPSNRAAKKAVKENFAKGHTMYIYRCPEYGTLHLTSKPSWDIRKPERKSYDRTSPVDLSSPPVHRERE